jgi:cephalosporin hydroxylase
VHVRAAIRRAASYLRPRPQRIPLSVNQVLEAQKGAGVVDQFNDLYVHGPGGNLNWRDVPVSKNPCDLWMMVELIQRLRPRIILETGTHLGGSALFYADILRLLGIRGGVITVDYNPKWTVDPKARGVESVVGYSTDRSVAKHVSTLVSVALAQEPGHVLVVLDSDHSEPNVTEELRLYAPLVTRGSYVVVEDTYVNGHPSDPLHGPGPYEAVQKFVAATEDFVIDRECQRFLLTFNPDGWLQRVR